MKMRRDQGVQTIETGAIHLFPLPTISEGLIINNALSAQRTKKSKFKIKPLSEQKPQLIQSLIPIKQHKSSLIKELRLPLIKPDFLSQEIRIRERISSRQENLSIVNSVSRVRNISCNDSIGRSDRSSSLSIRGNYSQIQSRQLI